MKKIAFIGAGIMGKNMIRNLMKEGYEMTVYDIRPEAVEDLVKEGATYCSTLAETAKGQDAVITMVTTPQVVESLYFGEGGILENADTGTYLIDMTTTEPSLEVKIYGEAQKKGLHFMDAPVTGGEFGAINKSLSILVGGEKADFDACEKLLLGVGSVVTYEGAVGAGQHTKMGNQIILSGVLEGISEAIAYARVHQLDGKRFIDSVVGGAAASTQLSQQGMNMENGMYEAGFFIKHFVKDLRIAKKEAEASGLKLEMAGNVLRQYETLVDKGMELCGMQALVQYYLNEYLGK